MLRDRWGVPHIYASNVHDLFFAHGYITARDRLFQIDLWRRTGTGKVAEVLGPSAVQRELLAPYVISQPEGVFDPTGVFAGMTVLAAVVLAVGPVVNRLEQWLLRWKPTREASGHAMA